MQIHWPLVVSTVCQRAGLGLYVCAWLLSLTGALVPMDTVAWITLAFLVVGGCASVFHLQRPARFFNAFSNFKSHLTQEGVLTPFLGLALILAGVGVVPLVSEACAAILAAAFLVVTGLAYQMKSRPAWNTPLVLVLFVLTALAAGLAGVTLVASACVPTEVVIDFVQPVSDAEYDQAVAAIFGEYLAVTRGVAIAAVVAIVACLAVQLGYVARMRKVGYGVAYDAMEQPYLPVTMTWAITAGAAAGLMALTAFVPNTAVLAAGIGFACMLVSVGAWTVLFFKGAHKVRMLPMYPVDLNLDM